MPSFTGRGGVPSLWCQTLRKESLLPVAFLVTREEFRSPSHIMLVLVR